MAGHRPSSNVPALAPPPGVTSNFVDPPSLRTLLYCLVAGTIPLVVGALALRIFIKIRLVKRWFWDDTMCVIAVFLFLVWLGISATNRYANLITRNEWNITVDDLEYVHFYEYILMLVYPPCMLTAKLSVLLQIQRLFTIQRDAFFYTAWTAIIIISLYYIASMFVFAFQCSPPTKAWDSTLAGTCTSVFLLEAVQAGFNVISDVATVALPIWAIFSLRLQVRKRLELLAIFSCGFLAFAMGICGMAYRIMIYNTADEMRALFIIGCFCSGETIMVILVGCVPAIAKMFFSQNWRKKSPVPDVNANPASPDANGLPSPEKAVLQPNVFLRGRADRAGLQDSRWNKSSVANSLARYLGPARELIRDQRRSNFIGGAKPSQHSSETSQMSQLSSQL